ncbi:hypothetical protein FRC03_004321 [Tulasnella sp. 419]|nr:hypothetical protein FRC02_008949 [Tulasnella sp. 418]KAG8962344.1 hypothetical protein FRC03_004321 [Tulasnella sp. 419]
MSTWTPQYAGLQEVLQVIRDSTNSESPEVQKANTMRLQTFTTVPDYSCYLVHILAQLKDEDDRVRAVAGLLLKNMAKTLNKSAPEVINYVKQNVLIAFASPSKEVRNAAGQVVVALMGALEVAQWPEALMQLMQDLDSQNPQQQEAAFGVLEKACEDYPKKLDVEVNGTRPLDFMVPKFIALAEDPKARIRAHALTSLSHFIPIQSQSLFAHIDAYIACLFKRAGDEDSEVRRNVCSSLVLLLVARPDRLIPEMNLVAQFMLYTTQDKDENVALEACEFWLTFAEEPDLVHHLQPLIPELAPVLLKCMVYSEEDLLWLDGVDEDAEQADKESDIKPRHYGGGKAHGLESMASAEQNPQAKSKFAGTLDDEDEFDDFDPDFDDDGSTEWNLRKCAAAALDILAVRFGDQLLNILLPHLNERLHSQDWLQKESAILALGAMAEGCIDAIEPHLPSIVPYLIQTLNDQKPLVRSIACWTLGRYAHWCTQFETEEQRNLYFVPAMEGLLRMVLDNNKRVQEAGCSAFATLEEDAGSRLAPYLEPILQNLMYAFGKYQQKNLLILYDAIGTLADAVGNALENPKFVDILMPPLIQKWSTLADDDDDLIPLLECLSSVTMATGQGFAAYAQPVFNRAIAIVHSSLVAWDEFQRNPDLDEPDKPFLIVALDLLSGLVQGLGHTIEPMIANSQQPLLSLVLVCLKHPQAPVRQSAYALIGDLAISCFNILRPFVPQLMPEVVQQIEPEPKPEFISASNNAAWSVGEIALRYGPDPEFHQYVEPLMSRLVPILLNPRSPKSLMENAAVTIGRISLVCPEPVAPHLHSFAQQWCQALWEIKDNEEKDSAFRGFCTLIQLNPNGISQHFLWFCNAVVKWNTPSDELREMFRKILTGFKQMSGAQWGTQIPPLIQEGLRERYGI